MGKKVLLSSGFMLSSMLGLLLCIFYIPQYNLKIAAAFGTVFFLMFIASMISMSYHE